MKKNCCKRRIGSQALERGLDVLRVLAEAPHPLTSTEIASQVGLHQSWTSRVLKTLSNAGYVRKPSYQQFALDYGVLTLGTSAPDLFAFAVKPRTAMAKLASQVDGCLVSLGMLHQGLLIWFLRTLKGQDTVTISSGRYPLHLSTIALRLLLDKIPGEACAVLKISRERYGWDRPTRNVPSTPKAVLEFARKNLLHDCLVLHDYASKGTLAGAIPVHVTGEPPVALAISGLPSSPLSPDQLMLHLQEGRRAIESSMTVLKGASA